LQLLIKRNEQLLKKVSNMLSMDYIKERKDKLKEGYIKRNTSTIPFGYEMDNESSTFLKPIELELEALQIAENMVVNEEVSLQAACDWLEYKTDRRISAPGLKKHIDKKYGLRSERLGTEPTSLLSR